jgi:hypothetical protein
VAGCSFFSVIEIGDRPRDLDNPLAGHARTNCGVAFRHRPMADTCRSLFARKKNSASLSKAEFAVASSPGE